MQPRGIGAGRPGRPASPPRPGGNPVPGRHLLLLQMSDRPQRILVVEDDTSILGILVVRLKAAGYEVFAAMDGLQGLKQAVEHKPDLVLMDIWMPIGMGFSVAERLRILELEHIPIIFMTASQSRALKK